MRSTFAGKGPGKGIYDVAYDLWLNGVGWGGGTTELMIWTENLQQVPLGTIKSTYTDANGLVFDVYHYRDTSDNSNVVSFKVKNNVYSGNFDLKAIINFGISKGYIPANPSVNQIGWGIEFCDTGSGTARFFVSDFTVTLN